MGCSPSSYIAIWVAEKQQGIRNKRALLDSKTLDHIVENTDLFIKKLESEISEYDAMKKEAKQKGREARAEKDDDRLMSEYSRYVKATNNRRFLYRLKGAVEANVLSLRSRMTGLDVINFMRETNVITQTQPNNMDGIDDLMEKVTNDMRDGLEFENILKEHLATTKHMNESSMLDAMSEEFDVNNEFYADFMSDDLGIPEVPQTKLMGEKPMVPIKPVRARRLAADNNTA